MRDINYNKSQQYVACMIVYSYVSNYVIGMICLQYYMVGINDNKREDQHV